MQCCVPSCVNTSTTESKGITFYGFPSDTYLRAAWLRALGKQDTHQPDPGVVCSLHFLDDDFYETEGCVRQIRSDAIPSTVQICMMCLDTDSKLVPMSKHQLEEVYQLLTGHTLCETANLQQTLCVLCAQRLIHFRTFRHMSLRARSLIMDLVQKYKFITMDHIKLMEQKIKQLKNFASATSEPDFDFGNFDGHQKPGLETTTGSDDPEHQKLQETTEENVAAVVKNEGNLDTSSIMECLDIKNEYPDFNNENLVASDGNFDVTLEIKPLYKDLVSGSGEVETDVGVKCERSTFTCAHCSKEFVEVNDYYEHLSMHLQDICDPLQVCEPRAAVGWNPPVRDRQLTQTSDAPSTIESHTSDASTLENIVQPSQEASAIQTNKQIIDIKSEEVDQSSPSTRTQTDVNAFQNYVVLEEIHMRTDTVEKQAKKARRNKKSYACELCDYKSARKNYLARHKLTHTVKKPYSCDTCNYQCVHRCDILRHVKIHSGEKPISCELCDYKCTKNSYLTRHMLIHTGEKRFSCDNCDYQGAHKIDIIKHMRTHTVNRYHYCDVCNYKCTKNGYLTRHKLTHTGKKTFSCQMCDYKCVRKDTLYTHMRLHTGEKPYTCSICNYKYSRKSYLNRHILTHTGVKPFPCEICSHQFVNKCDLLRHMTTHTGEKPFSCEICDYKCARKSQLARHKLTHSGEKPISCDLCDYRCAHKFELVRHMRSHTGESPYTCDICSYTFARNCDLARHSKTHTGERPYACDFCDFTCIQKNSLTRHVRTHAENTC